MPNNNDLIEENKVKTFADLKEETAKDCETVAQSLIELAAKVREGDMDAFEKWWVEGGTEEGDAKIDGLRDIILIRYAVRRNSVV